MASGYNAPNNGELCNALAIEELISVRAGSVGFSRCYDKVSDGGFSRPRIVP